MEEREVRARTEILLSFQNWTATMPCSKEQNHIALAYFGDFKVDYFPKNAKKGMIVKCLVKAIISDFTCPEHVCWSVKRWQSRNIYDS